MSEAETDERIQAMPAVVLPLRAPAQVRSGAGQAAQAPVTFSRAELNQILNLYGRMVAAGEWRDYAMDFGRDRAVFSVFRRTSEMPLYRIVKNPSLARKQGQYAVMAACGHVLKRGAELERVLRMIEKARLRLV